MQVHMLDRQTYPTNFRIVHSSGSHSVSSGLELLQNFACIAVHMQNNTCAHFMSVAVYFVSKKISVS